MAEYDYRTRQLIAKRRADGLKAKIERLPEPDRRLAQKIADQEAVSVYDLYGEDTKRTGERPSRWFCPDGTGQEDGPHQALLDAFVLRPYQRSYLYIIDKLNRFPFSRGPGRRCVRTADYAPQMDLAFRLLDCYERLSFFGGCPENYILRRMSAEALDYIRCYRFDQDFSYLYAAQIDLGDRAVIDALREVMVSENNTAYLDREMILGILRSDNTELQELLGKLLVAARLQEGLRQAVCESMDTGTPEAFLRLLKVVEEQDLIRFAAVKRAVSTWIGIYNETSVDRINAKLLQLMGSCLRDRTFLEKQLKTEYAVAVNTALWALGFYEVQDAIRAMAGLIDHGTKQQKLSASFYNLCLYSSRLKQMTAKKVLLEHGEDLELAAAFLPAFTSGIWTWVRESFTETSFYLSKIHTPKEPVLTRYYRDRREAEALYQCFGKICSRLPKKGVRYDPFVFPWHAAELQPSDLLVQMAFLAWLLQDGEKIDTMAERLGEITDGNLRVLLMNLLLGQPSGPRQRRAVIGYMGNTHIRTSELALQIVRKLAFSDAEYQLLEDMLRFKRGELRGHLIDFLMRQSDSRMTDCLHRLLSDKKAEKRSAGLDMLLRLSREEERAVYYQSVKDLIDLIRQPTDQEKILIQELRKGSKERADETKECALYDPDVPEELLQPVPEPVPLPAEELLRVCMPVTEQQAIWILQKMDDLFRKYKDYEYTTSGGDKCLLGNGFRCTKEGIQGKAVKNPYDSLEYYPLADVFQKFYEEEIGDFRTMAVLEAVMFRNPEAAMEAARADYERVFGQMPFTTAPLKLEYANQVRTLRTIYHRQFLDRKLLFETGLQVALALLSFLDHETMQIHYQAVGWNGRINDETRLICDLVLFSRYLDGLRYWGTDEEFVRVFDLAWRLEKRCREDRPRRAFHHSRTGLVYQEQTITGIRPYWFLKAFHMGLIAEDVLVRAVMEYFAREDCLNIFCKVAKGEAVKSLNGRLLTAFFGEEITNEICACGESYFSEDTWIGALNRKLYDKIVPVLVDTELRRGEAETEYSWDMRGITYIQGIDYLVRILMALGKDTFGRDTYYSWYYGNPKMTKREVLCGLLKACYPKEHETGADLSAAVKGTSIRAERFVETAMYAPQWIDIIQEHLGWKGLKSGCYYFMAHMNERFDDQKKAIIARYTPLTPEELQEGAFDVSWFEEAYALLGEKNFNILYQAAKYISDGQKHSRARKYADAATGKVTLQELAAEITAKRNKDLLMSYGLVPFQKDRDQDMLKRYQFIEQYRKESRQFGSQRRVSEGKAADIALVNLSVRAGYTDVTRLKLTMEARLIETMTSLMEWTAVEDVEVCLKVEEDGKGRILCRKDGRELKSVPARLGKQPYVKQLKEAHKNLKEQYQRTRRMMEESMESGAAFCGLELQALLQNPVVCAILRPLVFLYGEQTGFLRAGEGLSLELLDGTEVSVGADEELRIAHPFHLYQSGTWQQYQKVLFERRIRQPFKQVFRELYVKLPEELGLKASRMFAGNQIQPQKTVGCLRGRRWVADYEEGLQKIYYKENIVARIYAMADWFSPSDIEAPTLEWVEFFDRKTFQPLTMEQVPDLIYSEVMRDVDLAVSVAHAGGVDPESSHSTIEMRRRIVELNLPLFGLSNVILKDSHALIHGRRASYNVHLGSGVVHQEGGAMLHILPVHSQKRGRIFLPFVDEDPKTAEIMSKIVLLAEDQKIKDPSILDQIR